jgi:DedD protein
VLVLTAVVALPFVLDTKPRPVSADIAIEMQAPAASTAVAPAVAVPISAPAPASDSALQAAPDKPAPLALAPVETSKQEPAKAEPLKAAPDIAVKTDDGARAAALLNGAGYLIQAGSFTDKSKLAAVQTKLEKAGFQSFTQEATAKDGTAHTRIRLGPFATQVEANNVSARISKLGIKTIVIKP